MTEDIGRNLVLLVAIVMLAAIEITALIEHEDGTMLSVVVGAIATITGYAFGLKKRIPQ